GHGVLVRPLQDSWQRDLVAPDELIKATPAINRSEPMVRGRTNRAPEPGLHPKNGLGPRGEGGGDSLGFETPPFLVERQNAKPTTTGELANGQVIARIGDVDRCITGQAPGLA